MIYTVVRFGYTQGDVGRDFARETVDGKKLIATVPRGAKTGKITFDPLFPDGLTVQSPTDFTVTTTPAPLGIHSFSPAEGSVGRVIEIEGVSFGATAKGNKVYFGGGAETYAFEVNADRNQLKVRVPTHAESGMLKVEVGNSHSATSSESFSVVELPVPVVGRTTTNVPPTAIPAHHHDDRHAGTAHHHDKAYAAKNHTHTALVSAAEAKASALEKELTALEVKFTALEKKVKALESAGGGTGARSDPVWATAWLETRIVVRPNPAGEVLVVEAAVGQLYKIMDTKGQVLMEGQVSTKKEEIFIGHLLPGQYIVLFQKGSASVTHVFVKE